MNSSNRLGGKICNLFIAGGGRPQIPLKAILEFETLKHKIEENAGENLSIPLSTHIGKQGSYVNHKAVLKFKGRDKACLVSARGMLCINNKEFENTESRGGVTRAYSYFRSVLKTEGTSKQSWMVLMALSRCDDKTTPVMEAMVQLNPIRLTPFVSRAVKRSLTMP